MARAHELKRQEAVFQANKVLRTRLQLNMKLLQHMHRTRDSKTPTFFRSRCFSLPDFRPTPLTSESLLCSLKVLSSKTGLKILPGEDVFLHVSITPQSIAVTVSPCPVVFPAYVPLTVGVEAAPPSRMPVRDLSRRRLEVIFVREKVNLEKDN